MRSNNQPINTVDFAKALADETRQKIMALCCCAKVCVTDIVEQLNVSQPTVSHHLKILKAAGLVLSVRQGKQVFYTLNQQRLAESCCKLSVDFAPNLPITIVQEE